MANKIVLNVNDRTKVLTFSEAITTGSNYAVEVRNGEEVIGRSGTLIIFSQLGMPFAFSAIVDNEGEMTTNTKEVQAAFGGVELGERVILKAMLHLNGDAGTAENVAFGFVEMVSSGGSWTDKLGTPLLYAKGDTGMSAYELAKKHGYTGSEEEWVNEFAKAEAARQETFEANEAARQSSYETAEAHRTAATAAAAQAQLDEARRAADEIAKYSTGWSAIDAAVAKVDGAATQLAAQEKDVDILFSREKKFIGWGGFTWAKGKINSDGTIDETAGSSWPYPYYTNYVELNDFKTLIVKSARSNNSGLAFYDADKVLVLFISITSTAEVTYDLTSEAYKNAKFYAAYTPSENVGGFYARMIYKDDLSVLRLAKNVAKVETGLAAQKPYERIAPVDFLEMARKGMMVRYDGCQNGVELEDTGDVIIGTAIKPKMISHTSGINRGPIGFVIPAFTNINLSFWVRKNNSYGLGLFVYGSYVATNNVAMDGYIGARHISVNREAIENGTVYEGDLLVDSRIAVESARYRVDAVRTINGKDYFHYVLSIKGQPLLSGYQHLFKPFVSVTQTLYPLSSWECEVANIRIVSDDEIETAKNLLATDGNTTKINYSRLSEIADDSPHINYIKDSIELGVGVGANVYERGILSSCFDSKEKVATEVAIPESGRTVHLNGYRFFNADGSKSPIGIKSQGLEYAILRVVEPRIQNNEFDYDQSDIASRSFFFQCWFKLSEISGKTISRYGYLGTSFTYCRYPIDKMVDGQVVGKWSTRLIKRICTVGDLVCFRFYNFAKHDTGFVGDRGMKLACQGSSLIGDGVTCDGIESLTIFNPVLTDIEAIDPFGRYPSYSEMKHPELRGKILTLVGDSQYNNSVVLQHLMHTCGMKVRDRHSGGRSLAYGSLDTWLYGSLFLNAANPDAGTDIYLLTMSTNDRYAVPLDWDGTIDDAEVEAVLASYPTLQDNANPDRTEYERKLALFDAMSRAQRVALFKFIPTYCAYIRQIRETQPNAKIYLATVPIDAWGSLDPEVPNKWKDGYNAERVRLQNDAKLRKTNEAIRAIASRYSCPVIDFYTSSGLTYDNRPFHSKSVGDGTHWDKWTSMNCAVAAEAAIAGNIGQ